MKKIYKSPEVHVIEMQLQTMLMMSTSDEVVSGENGGWVKEERTNRGSSNVWDDDWSKE